MLCVVDSNQNDERVLYIARIVDLNGEERTVVFVVAFSNKAFIARRQSAADIQSKVDVQLSPRFLNFYLFFECFIDLYYFRLCIGYARTSCKMIKLSQ